MRRGVIFWFRLRGRRSLFNPLIQWCHLLLSWANLRRFLPWWLLLWLFDVADELTNALKLPFIGFSFWVLAVLCFELKLLWCLVAEPLCLIILLYLIDEVILMDAKKVLSWVLQGAFLLSDRAATVRTQMDVPSSLPVSLPRDVFLGIGSNVFKDWYRWRGSLGETRGLQRSGRWASRNFGVLGRVRQSLLRLRCCGAVYICSLLYDFLTAVLL